MAATVTDEKKPRKDAGITPAPVKASAKAFGAKREDRR